MKLINVHGKSGWEMTTELAELLSKHMHVSVPASGVILLYSAVVLGYTCFRPTALFECNPQCGNINMELLPLFSWLTFISYVLSILLIVAYLAKRDTMWLLASASCIACGLIAHGAFAALLKHTQHTQSKSRDPIELTALFSHLLVAIAASVVCFICLHFSRQARDQINKLNGHL